MHSAIPCRASACLAVTLLLLSVTWPARMLAQETNHAATNVSQQSGPAAREQPSAEFWKTSAFESVLWAFVVGSFGAAAFFFGVWCGFISREARERVLEFLMAKDGNARGRLLLVFCGFGGVVAAVFQAAQPSVFAPIQAFVLGATWPSVVTRIMSGNGSSPGLAAFANVPANQIPTPKATATTAAAAEVVI